MSIRIIAVIGSLLGLLTSVIGVSPASGAQVSTVGAQALAATAQPPNVPRPAGSRPPPVDSVLAQGSYFSYLKRSRAERQAIRNRVVRSINSTWGWYFTPVRNDPLWPTRISGWTRQRGLIQMTTWSFNDWGVRNALVNAARRGTQVRIIAARNINRTQNYQPWKSLKAYLNSPAQRQRGNWARECSGACRGAGGAPHSKYFIFKDMGRNASNRLAPRLGHATMQTSMNLTAFAYNGQWNQATVTWGAAIANRFRTVFNLSAAKRRGGYRSWTDGGITSLFFPKGGATDPVLRALNSVTCGSGAVRVIQYAIHGRRGNAVAKRLRALWNRGCNVRIIYSLSSRPVLAILRSRSGRGPIPVRQQVIKNRRGEIVRYNHSKWLAVRSGGSWFVHAGSANWSDLSLPSDEQMQELRGFARVIPYFRAFDKTWRQPTAKVPRIGRTYVGGRLVPSTPEQPVFGKGMLRHLTEWG
ncbi:MAG TPA: phospholipase D-like domain-containing protein [Marmoricola sp.]|nr:phospholipase D-like domain-containing protein [Marmoricola sp.]